MLMPNENNDKAQITTTRKQLECIFGVEHAEEVSNCLYGMFEMEQYLRKLPNKTRKSLLLALCREFGVEVKDGLIRIFYE